MLQLAEPSWIPFPRSFDLTDVRDVVYRPDPLPDPMTASTLAPAASSLPSGPSSARWLRRPDEVTWHVQVGPALGARIQRCTGGVALPARGEAEVGLDHGGVFGPACMDCARLEGCH